MAETILAKRIAGVYKPIFFYDDFSAKGRKRLQSEAKNWNRIVFGKWKSSIGTGGSDGAFIPNNESEAVTQQNADEKTIYSGPNGKVVSGFYWKNKIQPLSDPQIEC
jgi:hypothetical protein